MWPWQRRKARKAAEREEAEFWRELEERHKRPSPALARAAAAPELPEPHLLIKLPIEGSAEVTFVAPGYGELARLLDWLDHGPYLGIAEIVRRRR